MRIHLMALVLLAGTLGAEPLTDKAAHAGACWAISDVAAAGASALGLSKTRAIWAGFLVAVGTGALKETWDAQQGGRFDGLDLAADGAGALGSVIVAGWQLGLGAGSASLKKEW